LPHAESVLSRGPYVSSKTDTFARVKLLSHVAWYNKGLGNYSLAQKRLEEAMSLYEQASEANSREALRVQSRLATVLNQQGHIDRAIELFRRVADWQEKLLGSDHLETLETVDALAVALSNTLLPKHWHESEALGRQTLLVREHLLPKDHPDMLEQPPYWPIGR
jgi:tetratricopeptide (TPR) repeat protein